MVVFEGQLIVGAWVSTTVIVCVHVAVAPQLSVAVQVRTKVYSTGHVPGTCGPSACAIIVVPPHWSVAVAVPVAAGEVSVLHWTVASAGQVIAGGVFVTTIVWVQVDVFMQLSVAVHVRWIV
jgi:hypothetical protein